MLTNRQIFNKVKDHLLTQNCKSTNKKGSCAYRGENGTSCAVGCLINDEDYDEEIEGLAINSCFDPLNFSAKVKLKGALRAGGIPIDRITIKLLEHLQSLHDDNDPQDWPIALDKLEQQWFHRGEH